MLLQESEEKPSFPHWLTAEDWWMLQPPQHLALQMSPERILLCSMCKYTPTRVLNTRACAWARVTPAKLAETPARMDFHPLSNHLIDEGVDYRIWLTSCSYTARPPSLLVTCITGISGASLASPFLLLAAWTMNVLHRSGHVVSMHQAEHQQKCSLMIRLTLSDSFQTWSGISVWVMSRWLSTPGRNHWNLGACRHPRFVFAFTFDGAGSSRVPDTRGPSQAWPLSWDTFAWEQIIMMTIFTKATKGNHLSGCLSFLELPLGGPAALAAGLGVRMGTFIATVDPNAERLLSHLCCSTFLSHTCLPVGARSSVWRCCSGLVSLWSACVLPWLGCELR